MDLMSPEFSRMLLPCRLYGAVSKTLSSMFTVLENRIRGCSTHGWSCRQATAVHICICRRVFTRGDPTPSSRGLTDCLRLPSSFLGFPGGSAGKESACNVGDLGSIPGLGRAPGEGNGYPLQSSGLENPMECIVHGVEKSQTRLSAFHFS